MVFIKKLENKIIFLTKFTFKLKITIFWHSLNTFSLSSAQCQTITSIRIGFGYLMISNSQLFVLGTTPASPYNLQMLKITLLSTSVDWANQIACTGTWSASTSESLLSSDGSTIYSFFLFGSPYYLYFWGLSVSSGSVVTTRYKSSAAMTYVQGSALSGDYVVNFKFNY